jgi:5'-3' exonuclease
MIALLDGDIFAYRCAASAENDPAEVAVWRIKDSIEQTLDAVGADEFQLWLSDKKENNFRYAIYPEYKANRTQPKPVHLELVRDYLLSDWKANIAKGQEADDALGIAQCALTDSVICSIDKDLLQIPGKHYNFVKLEHLYVEPIDGIRHFYKQLLIGDRTDNIFGVYGLGPKKVAKLLDHINSVVEMYEIVKDHYDSVERMHMNAKVLWIRQQEEENWRPPVDGTAEIQDS